MNVKVWANEVRRLVAAIHGPKDPSRNDSASYWWEGRGVDLKYHVIRNEDGMDKSWNGKWGWIADCGDAKAVAETPEDAARELIVKLQAQLDEKIARKRMELDHLESASKKTLRIVKDDGEP